MEKSGYEHLAKQVSVVSIVGNTALTIFKLLAGILAHSGAMVSDAVHSASDVLSTIIVLVGVKLSCKAADTEHPYGHDRFECVASIILAGILFFTGAEIGITALQNIFSGNTAALAVPGLLALIAAVVSIAVKEWMFWYTRAAAKKLDSVALRASAWHHRSDALSSVGSFAGILGARLGAPVLDSVASVAICVCIIKVSIDIFRDAVSRTVDRACSPEANKKISAAVAAQEGVEGVDLLRTRQFGAGIYVDVEIEARGSLTLDESHAIAERVHHAVEAAEPTVRHCMVHVNPCDN